MPHPASPCDCTPERWRSDGALLHTCGRDSLGGCRQELQWEERENLMHWRGAHWHLRCGLLARIDNEIWLWRGLLAGLGGRP